MRILFFLHNLSKMRHFDSVIVALAERGHTVVLAAEQRAQAKPLTLPKIALNLNRRLAQSDLRGRGGRIELATCPVQRSDDWRGIAPALRRARDYVRFLDPQYEHADKLRERAAGYAPEGWPRFLDERRWLRRRPRHLARLLALAERLIPSDAGFEEFIRAERPDLVLITPLVHYVTYQTDYVKSAHRLGVPVGFLVFSWDNLTNGPLVRVQADRTVVWNNTQKRELVAYHQTQPDQIIVTGAPRFDAFFAMQPSSSREDFLRGVGLEPASPLFLYICSSAFVAPHEVEFVRRWIAALRASADPAIRESGVLVRPHPAHVEPWERADLSEFLNVACWSAPETMNADQGLYDSLFHANAVVGLNTSAMIEAGILGKSVHTILTSEFAGGQEQTIHFGYLRAANGGLLHEAHGLGEHIQQLSAALRTNGMGSDQVRQFVEHFVRPHGLETPVTPIMVEAIERIARVAKTPQGNQPLWQRPVRWALRRYLSTRT